MILNAEPEFKFSSERNSYNFTRRNLDDFRNFHGRNFEFLGVAKLAERLEDITKGVIWIHGSHNDLLIFIRCSVAIATFQAFFAVVDVRATISESPSRVFLSQAGHLLSLLAFSCLSLASLSSSSLLLRSSIVSCPSPTPYVFSLNISS